MPISKITGTCYSFYEKFWLPEEGASAKGFRQLLLLRDSGSVMRNLDPVAIRVFAEEIIRPIYPLARAIDDL